MPLRRRRVPLSRVDLCHSQERGPDAVGGEPFQSYVCSEDPAYKGSQWCAVHRISDVLTRVPLMPLFPFDGEEADDDTLYDVTDMYGIEYYE